MIIESKPGIMCYVDRVSELRQRCTKDLELSKLDILGK